MLELAVLEALTPRDGYEWSVAEIAEVCGVSRQNIQFIVNHSLKKIRRAIGSQLKELRENLAS